MATTHRLLPKQEADRYGFDWPDTETLTGTRVAQVQVTRTSSIVRANGEYRVLAVTSEIDQVHVYVSPTGRIRVFREGDELKGDS